MIRKIAIVVALLALLAGQVYAGQVQKTLISSTILTNVTNSTNGTQGGNADKIGYFVRYNESSANANVTIVPSVSYDGSNYTNMSFYDVAGGVTPQTAEVIATNQTYYFWMNPVAPAPYIKVTATADNVNLTTNATIIVYSVQNQ